MRFQKFIRNKLNYSLCPQFFHFISPLRCRKLYSETKKWPISCAFEPDCILNLLKEIESYWKPILKEKWAIDAAHSNCHGSNHRFILSMFPYPSGSLHLGHVRVYTNSDIIARYCIMKGHQVTNAMGWDSFGLPAENAALERSVSPAIWTYDNINHMENQLEALSFNLNWREATSDPSFYKWTQWLFIKLFKSKLIYKSMSQVNWDPVDQTVLANDQVDEEGRSWRSGAKVEKKHLRQWTVKITPFLQELYESESVDMADPCWKELVCLQRPFLGEPSTYAFYLEVGKDTLQLLCDNPEYFKQKNSYIAVSSNHWLVGMGIDVVKNPFTEEFLGIKVINDPKSPLIPANGFAILLNSDEKKDEVARDAVLEVCKNQDHFGGYRASKFFFDWVISRQRYWGTPIPIINCKNCGNVPVPESDLPVLLPPVNDLKVLKFSSEVVNEPHMSRLSRIAPKTWLNTECPVCKKPARRETDTCDTFFDSSWYYLRYASQPSNDQPFDEKANYNPVWLYLGGTEHSRGHLLYARYIYRFLKKYNLLESKSSEPFHNLLFLGYIHGRTIKKAGRYISEDNYDQLIEQGMKPEDFAITFEKMSKSKGNGVDPMALMDSFGVDATRACIIGYGHPRHPREWHGSKTEFTEILVFLRRLLLTMDQFIFVREIARESPHGPTVKRFVCKSEHNPAKLLQSLQTLTFEREKLIKKVSSSMENFHNGRALRSLRDFLYFLRKFILVKNISDSIEFERCLGDMLIMLDPIIPHIAEECWSAFRQYANPKVEKYYDLNKMLMEQNWPLKTQKEK